MGIGRGGEHGAGRLDLFKGLRACGGGGLDGFVEGGEDMLFVGLMGLVKMLKLLCFRDGSFGR